MKTQNTNLVLTLLMLISFGYAFSQQTTAPGRDNLRYRRFYRPNFPNTNREIILSDDNPSRQLTRALASLSNDGGGTLTVTGPRSIELRNVIMSSNVHLRFRNNITLKFPDGTDNFTMIKIGDKERVSNIAITCAGNDDDRSNWFKVDFVDGLPENRRATTNRSFINLSDVRGFMIAGFEMIDDYTNLNGMTLNPPDNERNGSLDTREFGPRNGIIRNSELSGKANKAYGMIQIQSANNVIFSKLSGIGGAIVRLESGSAETNLDRPGGPRGAVQTIDEVYVRDITVIGGAEALLLSPHRIPQGKVDADMINAISSIVAVKIQAGFKDQNNGSGNIRSIPPLGSFASNSIITNVTATAGEDNIAPYTFDGEKYLTCDQRNNRNFIDNRASKRFLDGSKPGRALGGVHYLSDVSTGCKDIRNCYSINMNADEVSLSGSLVFNDNARRLFGLSNRLSVIEEDGTTCKDKSSRRRRRRRRGRKIAFTSESSAEENFNKTVYPNPTSSNIYLNDIFNWSLYSINGQLIKEGKGNQIDLSNEVKGVYFIKTNNKMHKIIKI